MVTENKVKVTLLILLEDLMEVVLVEIKIKVAVVVVLLTLD